MEKKARLCMLFTMSVLCTFFFCTASYAQPDSGCSHGSHEYVSEVEVPASEDEPGQVRNTCIYCQNVYMETLPATGHDFGPWEAVQGQEEQGGLERRICSRCGRSEERQITLPAVSEETSAELPDAGDSMWRANEMDVVLTAATGGVWGYAAVVLWWNSLVLVWYKKECLRKKKEKRS